MMLDVCFQSSSLPAFSDNISVPINQRPFGRARRSNSNYYDYSKNNKDELQKGKGELNIKSNII